LIINGERVQERVDARKTLVDFLREDLSLTGSHVGCEHGVCGACTVRVNGEIVRGCLMLAVHGDGSTVETIEGMSDPAKLLICKPLSSSEMRCSAAIARPVLAAAQDLLKR
jgi:carbon-monoxide dehydrogenase small subunit